MTDVEKEGELSAEDERILRFAAHAPRSSSAREEAVRRELGLSPVRFYQRLNVLIDVPEARRRYPLLLSRLDRLRSCRRL
ncbi:DUF3263 domain-containing protein [Corynebacterium atypicum]|nr:DUF3263 domain-containing protein [Corynebacterium atypicum]